METATTNKSFYFPLSYLVGEYRQPYVSQNQFLNCLQCKFTVEIPGSRRRIDLSVFENLRADSDGVIKKNPLFEQMKSIKSGSLVMVGVCYNVTFSDDGRPYYNYYVRSVSPVSQDAIKAFDRMGVKLIE